VPSGVVIPYWLDRPPEEAVEVAQVAEAAGYRELWIGEMVHFDAFALAGAIAAQTQKITITVGPLAVGLRDPVLLAMGVASVAVIGRRPAGLALGGSTEVVVERWHGKQWGNEPARMGEAIGLIKSVLAGERTNYAGDRFVSRGFRSALGAHETTISVAAFGPRMLAVAERLADRVVVNLVSADYVAAMTEGITKPCVVWVAVAVDPTPEGLTQLARQVAIYIRSPAYRTALRASGLGDLIESVERHPDMPSSALAEAVTPDHLARVAAFGSRAEVEETLACYERAGAEVMAVPVTGGDPGGRRTLTALAG
jgi:probable F420-dependent oxidoreductase